MRLIGSFVLRLFSGLVAALLISAPSRAEDGYQLWLRYAALPQAEAQALSRQAGRVLLPPEAGAMAQAAAEELERGIAGLSGRKPARGSAWQGPAVVLALPGQWAALQPLDADLKALREGGYLLRTMTAGGQRVAVIGAASERGLLYGSFAWLRALQTGADLARLDQRAEPKVAWRMLNHWDNLDRTVERGYAGQSIWNWWELPDMRSTRYRDYARANASLGINGVVLNNVNSKPEVLASSWLPKVAAIAEELRPYGQKVFLSVRFSSPKELGGLANSDPANPAVRAWWQAKVDEVYRLIPDFGGFLVKANSEGQPGPHDYGRSHAEGAAPMADALRPHGGLLIWRAFVYSEADATDRAKQAYQQFVPWDGKFASNVVVQVKNGAIDFQPREPFHPMFGAMPKTQLGMEFQITKEYLGFATHLAYLGPMYEEVLRADTQQPGGTGRATVARILDGSFYGDGRVTMMAGVANVGSERNWSGSHFDQANWYVFGRMAWDPELKSEAIAREWVQQTFSAPQPARESIVQLMQGSREAVVNYMTPLGLHHLMATSHHYGPGLWVSELARPEWNPVYYHRADKGGIGFDRSPSGSNAVAQYAPAVAARWARPATTEPELLLWFHHLPWDYKLPSGQALWPGLIAQYDLGVRQVGEMRARWDRLKGVIDAERFADVAARLKAQEREAQWWRDASVAYFQSVNGLPLPAGVAAPALKLEDYKARHLPYAP